MEWVNSNMPVHTIQSQPLLIKYFLVPSTVLGTFIILITIIPLPQGNPYHSHLANKGTNVQSIKLKLSKQQSVSVPLDRPCSSPCGTGCASQGMDWNEGSQSGKFKAEGTVQSCRRRPRRWNLSQLNTMGFSNSSQLLKSSLLLGSEHFKGKTRNPTEQI
jgi:hypothetical protein